MAVANTVSIALGSNTAEPATNGFLAITLNNPAPAGGVTVMYTLSGTATEGTDYTHPQSGTGTIPAGANAGNIQIMAIDDNMSEPTESIVATISSVNAGFSVATGTATISLLANESTTIYAFDFSACTSALSDGFTQQSVVGTQTWGCTTFGRSGNGVQMNGFATTAQANEDWLISPPLDLSATVIPLLAFYSRSAFNGAPLQLFITGDFTGNVTTTTWTELSTNFPASGSDVWTLSQNINLSAFKQSNVRIAFKYTSITAAASRWTLDDISILNSTVAPPPELNVKNSIVDFRHIGVNEIAIGKFFNFWVSNAAASLTITAPDAFLLSKNNFNYSKTITYSVAELATGQKPVYVGFLPYNTQYNLFRDAFLYLYRHQYATPPAERKYVSIAVYPECAKLEPGMVWWCTGTNRR